MPLFVAAYVDLLNNKEGKTMKNFYRNTDTDGNMPALSQGRPVKRHYVEYRDDMPVMVKAYPGQDRVWDYAAGRMLSLIPGLLCWDGSIMPVYKGELIT